MTVAVETPVTSSAGDGVTTTFATVWTFEVATDVTVYVETAGVAVLQVQGADYDVVAPTPTTTGGDVVFRAGHIPAALTEVHRVRATPLNQTDAMGDLSKFLPSQAVRSFDRLVRQVQELQAEIGRAVEVPIGGAGLVLPAESLREDAILGFSADGSAFRVDHTFSQLDALLAAGTFTPPASPLHNRSFQSRLAETVSVEDSQYAATDHAAAFNEVFAYAATLSGGCKVVVQDGKRYTLNEQVALDAGQVFVDLNECWIIPAYAGGAAFTIGNGVTSRDMIGFQGGRFLAVLGISKPIFELRAVRSFMLDRCRGDNVWQLAHWGLPGDATPCFQWWHTNCEWNMRNVANGDHSHGILTENSVGGYYESDVTIEADKNSANSPRAFYIPNTFVPVKFDHLTRTGGDWGNFFRGLDVNDSRIVNLHLNPGSRIDDTVDVGVRIVATGAPPGPSGSNGCAAVHIGCHFGGDNTAGGILISTNAAPAVLHGDLSQIDLSGVSFAICRGVPITLQGTGGGYIQSVLMQGCMIEDHRPGVANLYGVNLTGDVRGLIDGVFHVVNEGAGTITDYSIYNNTGASVPMKIGPAIQGNRNAIGLVYDPNPGDAADRHCAVTPGGSPRGKITFGPYTLTNLAAATAVNMFVDASNNFTLQRSPSRGRVVGVVYELHGTITAGTITVVIQVNGVTVAGSTKVFSAADGADPFFTVADIPGDTGGGTTALNAGDAVAVLVTSNGALTPATLDLIASVVILET